jgi:hypothetical protein
MKNRQPALPVFLRPRALAATGKLAEKPRAGYHAGFLRE